MSESATRTISLFIFMEMCVYPQAGHDAMHIGTGLAFAFQLTKEVKSGEREVVDLAHCLADCSPMMDHYSSCIEAHDGKVIDLKLDWSSVLRIS